MMANKVKTEKLIENATPTQKERMLTLEGLRYNILGEMADKKMKHDTARSEDKKTLDKLEADLSALLEAIQSGQATLAFDEGGEGDRMVDVCPDCDGMGKDPDDRRKRCGTCDGTGTIPRSPKTSLGP